jgi:hypothetical protein
MLLRRRTLFQTAWQANLCITLVAPVSAMTLCRLLGRDGLLTSHFGQVAAAAVVARKDYAGVLVGAHGVSERLLALGLRAGRDGGVACRLLTLG